MSQVAFEPFIPPYPAPMVLVGAKVDGHVNFLAAAWFSMVSYEPPGLMVALNHAHYTNLGINQTKEFSVCIPSKSMTQVTDYCGIVSGRKHDKSKLFDVFYGELEGAPLISQCPMNIECKVTAIQRVGASEVFFGEVVQIHVDDSCLVDGKPDMALMQPFVLDSASSAYCSIGEVIDQAWSSGKRL
jgi:flavin reductase (DIM6/NTAB) family NADH-FMN oxidoreductase RutF